MFFLKPFSFPHTPLFQTLIEHVYLSKRKEQVIKYQIHDHYQNS